jgi:hypothetical protein
MHVTISYTQIIKQKIVIFTEILLGIFVKYTKINQLH